MFMFMEVFVRDRIRELNPLPLLGGRLGTYLLSGLIDKAQPKLWDISYGRNPLSTTADPYVVRLLHG